MAIENRRILQQHKQTLAFDSVVLTCKKTSKCGVLFKRSSFPWRRRRFRTDTRSVAWELIPC